MQREWPKLVLPAAGVMLAVSVVGPMLFGATFLALLVAGSMATFAVPLMFVVGAGVMAGGVGVVAAVGMAGLYLLPTLLSLLAVAGGAWLGARLVGSYLWGPSPGDESDDGMVDVSSTGYRSTPGAPPQPGAVDGKTAEEELERELERMRRDAAEDLRSFDEALKFKDRSRG